MANNYHSTYKKMNTFVKDWIAELLGSVPLYCRIQFFFLQTQMCYIVDYFPTTGMVGWSFLLCWLLFYYWQRLFGLAKIRWPFHFKWCYINVTLYSNNQLWWYILHCRDKKIGFPVIYNIIMLHVFIYVYLKNKGTKNGLFWLLCCCT